MTRKLIKVSRQPSLVSKQTKTSTNSVLWFNIKLSMEKTLYTATFGQCIPYVQLSILAYNKQKCLVKTDLAGFKSKKCQA